MNKNVNKKEKDVVDGKNKADRSVSRLPVHTKKWPTSALFIYWYAIINVFIVCTREIKRD